MVVVLLLLLLPVGFNGVFSYYLLLIHVLILSVFFLFWILQIVVCCVDVFLYAKCI